MLSRDVLQPYHIHRASKTAGLSDRKIRLLLPGDQFVGKTKVRPRNILYRCYNLFSTETLFQDLDLDPYYDRGNSE